MNVVCANTGSIPDLLPISHPVYINLKTESSTPNFLDSQTEDDVIFHSLPALHRGHPEIHLRNGVMNAYRLSGLNVPDAEKAFFVADLSQVFRQHERWRKHLPGIHPFYGSNHFFAYLAEPSDVVFLFPRIVQP
jgi:hypothetical protein